MPIVIRRKKKPNYLGALGLAGLGAAGMYGLDKFFNKGQLSNSLFNSLRKRFTNAAPVKPAINPAFKAQPTDEEKQIIDYHVGSNIKPTPVFESRSIGNPIETPLSIAGISGLPSVIPGIAKKFPTYAKWMGAPLMSAFSTSSGYNLGDNELVQEAFKDSSLPLKTLGTAAGALTTFQPIAPLKLLPILADLNLKAQVSNLKDIQANNDYTSTIGDQALNMYKNRNTFTPEQQVDYGKWLNHNIAETKDLNNNPGLSRYFAYPGTYGKHESFQQQNPVINHLLQKSRNSLKYNL